MFVERNEQVFGRISRTVALDIGCGSGASLAWLATQFEQVVGIDPSLPSLILARKLREENGVDNATLIRGFGQHIPFDANTFNFVSAQNVLEHVFTIDEVVAEVARVLMEKGGFSADSRNRFDLLFKEPHVKLRWIGFLPRDLARRYVEWRTGQPYDHTKLQSYWNSKHALRQAFGSQIKIAFPDVAIYGFPSKIGKPLVTLEQIDWIAQPMLTLFPSHLLLARKL
jgi:ubiquinone/menaquinone biosynthesis C-methylase UbiE